MRTLATTLILVLSLVASCGSSRPSGPTGDGVTPVTPVTPEPTTPTTPPIAAEAYGATCSAATACAAGLACTTYYGIAGPQGPAFQSCEIPCGEGKAACPKGTTCITVADGPGTVCRPAS